VVQTVIDLTMEDDEIQFHIHNRDRMRTPYRVARKFLQDFLDRWKASGGGANVITLPARSPRLAVELTLVFDRSGIVQVRDPYWWIRVNAEEMKYSLQELGFHAPW
jgi:hypothetical protein